MTTTSPREPRSSVILYARLDGAVEARVRNLSTTGACIDNPGGLAQGQVLRVAMGVLPELSAEVMWVAPTLAGLHFTSGAIDLAAARKPRPREAVAPKPVAPVDPTQVAGTAPTAGWMNHIRHAYRRG